MKKIAAVAITAALLAGLGAGTANAATGTISSKTVAKHKTASNCWSTINGQVYNLTGYIKRHPGGAGLIIAICGKNGSQAFNGQHMGSGKAAAELAAYRIGRAGK